MDILLMICIPNYMIPVLFQQCYMVLKYFDMYTLVILKKYKKEHWDFFMGVHNSTPIQAMMGDMGWTDIYILKKYYACYAIRIGL